jgi:hypothetical protein
MLPISAPADRQNVTNIGIMFSCFHSKSVLVIWHRKDEIVESKAGSRRSPPLSSYVMFGISYFLYHCTRPRRSFGRYSSLAYTGHGILKNWDGGDGRTSLHPTPPAPACIESSVCYRYSHLRTHQARDWGRLFSRPQDRTALSRVGSRENGSKGIYTSSGGISHGLTFSLRFVMAHSATGKLFILT